MINAQVKVIVQNVYQLIC